MGAGSVRRCNVHDKRDEAFIFWRKARKYLLALAALLCLISLVSGCCSQPEREATERMRGVIRVWKDRSLKYSAEDETLSAAKKQDDVDYWDALESYVKDREEALAK